MNDPKIATLVSIKPGRAAERGVLPPELADSLKASKFEIIKLQTEDKTNRPSAALKMPIGVGEELTINGTKMWAWWVFNDDIMENEDLKKSPEIFKKIKAGDTIRAININDTSISAEENYKGLRVLGNDGYGFFIVEAPKGKGDIRTTYGKNTLRISAKNAVLIEELKLKVNDFVKIKHEHLNDFPLLVSTDQMSGHKILEIKDNKVIIEARGQMQHYGYESSKYSNKSIIEVDIHKIEASPSMDIRIGDWIRVKPSEINDQITEKQKRQKMEIVDIHGDFHGFNYSIKLPNGKIKRIDNNKIFFPTKDSMDVIKKGMKIKIQAEHRDDELPDSLNKSAKTKFFEVLEVDDDSVLVKVPSSCEECSFNDVHKCRVWYVGRAYLEQQDLKQEQENKKMSKSTIDRNEMSFTDRVKANTERAAIKTVGKKLTMSVKSGLLRALEASARDEGTEESEIASGVKMFTKFMASNMGNAMISALIGLAIQQAGPQLSSVVEAFGDPKVQDLADEMQSEGASLVMDKLVDVVTEYILPDVADILKGLPSKKEGKTKKNIATETAKKSGKRTLIKVGNTSAWAENSDGVDEVEEEEVDDVKTSTRRRAA